MHFCLHFNLHFLVFCIFRDVDRNKSWPWFLFAVDLEIEKFGEEFPPEKFIFSVIWFLKHNFAVLPSLDEDRPGQIYKLWPRLFTRSKLNQWHKLVQKGDKWEIPIGPSLKCKIDASKAIGAILVIYIFTTINHNHQEPQQQWPKRYLRIVMSGQFYTLAMFLCVFKMVSILSACLFLFYVLVGLFITLIKCFKGRKSLGSLSESVF